MIKKIAIAIGVLIATVLLYAATRPNTLHIERTATIQAPPGRIHPLIDDFRQWRAWSPYEKIDPAMKRTYSGPPEGKGAVYEWQGNGNVGAGRMEITGTKPSAVTIKLDFTAPLEGHNVARFSLAPEGEATRVTWTMDGPTPYAGKLIGVFMDMDAMIGGAFDDGLANLKKIAEQ